MATVKVRPLNLVAAKWNTRAASASPEYEIGVTNPRAPWDAQSLAAKKSWQDGGTQAAARDAYAKGVSGAGAARWQAKTLAKGPARFSQGVAVSQADYEKGFAPYRDAIERVDLPPRGPTGSPQYLQRMTGIPQALAALKRR